MKKFLTLALFLTSILSFALLFNSCQDSELSVKNDEIISDDLLEEAKEWHSLQTNSPGAFDIKKLNRGVLQPIWKEARLEKLPDGRSVITAPAKDFVLENDLIGLQRGFMFLLNNGKITDGIITEFYAEAEYISDNRRKLPNKLLNNQMGGFTGSVITYNLQYRYIYGREFNNGKETGSRTVLNRKISSGENLNSGRTLDGECYSVYFVTYWSDGSESWDYMYSYCDSGGGGSESAGGGGNEPGVAGEQTYYDPIVVGDPDPYAVPIADIEDHLKCFDSTKPARVTIYVDQPSPNNNQCADWLSPTNVGHAFLGIDQDENSRTIGFYPESLAYPLDPNKPSQMKDNAGKPWDVSISIDVSADELADLLDYIQNGTPENYDLDTFNCTNWVASTWAGMGINLPQNNGTGIGGGRMCPGQFGQDLRDFTMPDREVTTSTTNQTGNAPANKGNCP